MPVPLRQICSVLFCKTRFTPETTKLYMRNNDLNVNTMTINDNYIIINHKAEPLFKPDTFTNLYVAPGILYRVGTILK
jgi:hypothetical protein